jgi:hypothetical protein
VPLLQKAIVNGCSFVVGDSCGTDTMAQEFLSKSLSLVTVYHMFDSPRNNCGFKTISGFQSDKERDTAMTTDSDGDIAWVRPGREKSGTAKNLRRRINNLKPIKNNY